MTAPDVTSERPAGSRRPARAAAVRRSAGRQLRCAISLALAAAALGGCGFGAQDGMGEAQAAVLTHGGSAARGRAALRAYGCGSCHTIAGVPGANSLVGPPLVHMGERAYVAGVLTNTPEHLVRWIRDPRGVDSLTAMPNLGVAEQDARDMAAYIYSIK